jgi:hypothetical protein
LANEKSINEKLAEAQAEFDARLKAEKHEAKVEAAAVVERTKPKPQKVRVVPKSKRYKVGAVAHTHWQEREDDMLEVDCLYVNHFVNDRKGFKINNIRYAGNVIVPRCVADYLSKMENDHKANERQMFENRGRNVFMGEIGG